MNKNVPTPISAQDKIINILIYIYKFNYIITQNNKRVYNYGFNLYELSFNDECFNHHHHIIHFGFFFFSNTTN